MLIYTEITPNPQSLKFSLPPDAPAVVRGSYTFERASTTEPWPAGVTALLAIPGVESIFLTRAFITVTKHPETSWHELIPAVKEVLKIYLSQGPLVEVSDTPAASEAATGSLEAQVIEAIETYIRPAIAMDGGDVEYVGYEDGVVRLRLMGSCVGCPSSTMTLKAGIENLLRRLIPDIKAVEAE